MTAMLRRYRLALGLWLCAVAMVFIAFISAYFVRGGVPNYEAATGTYSMQWEPPFLPVSLLVLNTCVLLAAALALEFARRSVRRAVPDAAYVAFPIWLWASLLLSLGFLAGQARVWEMLRSNGHTIGSGARAAFAFVVTGAHAAQIAGLALVVFWIAARQRRWQPMQRYIAADLAAWYLHAMAVLWIALLCVLVWG